MMNAKPVRIAAIRYGDESVATLTRIGEKPMAKMPNASNPYTLIFEKEATVSII
jgi:hypothetical protein